MTWLLFAFLSAVFAALTSILAKIGIKDVNSNLATAIRTSVILIFAWGIVIVQGLMPKLGELSKTAWIFLVLSGIATGLSWLFYFRALQLGEASKVVPIDKLSLVLTIIMAGIFLHEKITVPMIFGVNFDDSGCFSDCAAVEYPHGEIRTIAEIFSSSRLRFSSVG